MFSVDNFYNFVALDYGYHATKNLIMVFDPHGSKDWHHLLPFGLPPDFYLENPDVVQTAGRIVMHDQEPLFVSYLDTYRSTVATKKINQTGDDNHVTRNLKRIDRFSPALSDQQWLRNFIGGQISPIICHSERNSDDIKYLQDQGFLTCYYWWHGMIARDWFRHWEHYKDLQPTDKSRNPQKFLLYARAIDGTRSYRADLLNHCRQHKQQVLYNWNNSLIPSDASGSISIEDSSPPIHLVAETLFFTNKIYLTEKVFKPMVMSQAFILFAPPGSLEYLKEYGFQTFSSCWDESYDLETDHHRRMEKLLNLVDHLTTLSPVEFEEIYRRSLPIIRHNRLRFFSRDFQDDLILEMRGNLDRALLEQNHRHDHGLDYKSCPNSDNV